MKWVKTAEDLYERFGMGHTAAQYVTLKLCHFIFIATDWCTNPARLSSLPAETRVKVKACLERGLAVMAPDADAKVLEVYLEVVLCLKALESQSVARVELPKVRRKCFP